MRCPISDSHQRETVEDWQEIKGIFAGAVDGAAEGGKPLRIWPLAVEEFPREVDLTIVKKVAHQFAKGLEQVWNSHRTSWLAPNKLHTSPQGTE